MASPRSAGYSLIELLMYIAIIGILAALILLGVLAARSKAADARIRNDIAQLRWEAEIVFDSQGANFTGWSRYHSVSDQVEILLADIADALGGTGAATVLDGDSDSYCVSAPLVSASNRHYCVDHRGTFEEVSSPCLDVDPDPSAVQFE